MKLYFFLVLLLCFALNSCEKIFVKPNPKTDNLSIFNEYATLVQEKYAMLEPKEVNIRHLKDSIAGTITGDENEAQLFEKLLIITKRLKDGHSSLSGKNLGYSFDTYKGYLLGLDHSTLTLHYINTSKSPNLIIDENGEEGQIKIAYGTLLNHSKVGYVRIPSFNVEISKSIIEEAFKSVQHTKGLIVDIRGNGGGDPSLAVRFASYFTDSPVYTGFEKIKSGPGFNDFAKSHITMKPTTNENKYLNKPVYVLTDRGCYSATTTFCYSVDPLTNIKFIGQRTGGGSGGVTDGFLANGWVWSLSTTEFVDAKGRFLDDGFDPDIPVALDKDNSTKDEVIEKAIELINNI